MSETTIKYWLLIDWKDEDVRVRKTKPNRSEIGTTELLVKGETSIQKPDIDVPTLSTELQVPEARIRRVMADGMEADTDHPDWFETVNEVLEANPWILDDEDPNAATLLVLKQDPGSPPVEAVEDRVREQMRKMMADH